MSDQPVEAAIRLQGLTRRFGDFTAVDAISLSVPPGSFFGFLGPNGAGKSTTIKMLTGLLTPTTGDAWIGGLSIREQPVDVKRLIGVMPEDLALFDRLSHWEHLTMVGGIYGLSRAETEQRAQDLLQLLDLWEARGTLAAHSSHGMKKKLALAMALIHAPRVLFLDEPFEGIDVVAGRTIRQLLTRLTRSGTTIFLTSHLLEVVERLADRVAIIADGRIALKGTMAELADDRNSLEDAFVAAVGQRHDTAELSWLA